MNPKDVANIIADQIRQSTEKIAQDYLGRNTAAPFDKLGNFNFRRAIQYTSRAFEVETSVMPGSQWLFNVYVKSKAAAVTHLMIFDTDKPVSNGDVPLWEQYIGATDNGNTGFVHVPLFLQRGFYACLSSTSGTCTVITSADAKFLVQGLPDGPA